jgi:hypothetical protein
MSIASIFGATSRYLAECIEKKEVPLTDIEVLVHYEETREVLAACGVENWWSPEQDIERELQIGRALLLEGIDGAGYQMLWIQLARARQIASIEQSIFLIECLTGKKRNAQEDRLHVLLMQLKSLVYEVERPLKFAMSWGPPSNDLMGDFLRCLREWVGNLYEIIFLVEDMKSASDPDL